MKTNHLIACVALLAAIPAFAAFESIRPAPDNELPLFPTSLRFDGITHGHVIVALSVDETGKLQDTLMLAYSDERLARATAEALQHWRFAPARLDGQTVPAQTELRFDFTLEGAVVSGNITELYLEEVSGRAGLSIAVYRPSRLDELDRVPERLVGEAPRAAPGADGQVEVRFYIDEQGAVRLPSVPVDTRPDLADKAVTALRTWKFTPPTSHGRPVLVTAAQKFNFGGAK